MSIGADHAFIAFDREQDRLRARRRDGGKDPVTAMDMPEEPLFDRARRVDGQRERERAGVIGDLRLVRAHVDHCDEVLVRVKHRRAAAAERRVPRPEVVAAMNRDGRLFSDTRADAVGALDALCPDAALPDAPVLELLDPRRLAAHVDDHAVGTGEEERVSDLADGGKEPVVLVGCDTDQLVHWRAAHAQLLRGQDPRRLPAALRDPVALRAPLPRGAHRLKVGQVNRRLARKGTHARHQTWGALASISLFRLPREGRLGILNEFLFGYGRAGAVTATMPPGRTQRSPEQLPLNNPACFPLSGGYVEQRFQRKLQRDNGGSYRAHLAWQGLPWIQHPHPPSPGLASSSSPVFLRSAACGGGTRRFRGPAARHREDPPNDPACSPIGGMCREAPSTQTPDDCHGYAAITSIAGNLAARRRVR